MGLQPQYTRPAARFSASPSIRRPVPKSNLHDALEAGRPKEDCV
jgi:hypothetical protein